MSTCIYSLFSIDVFCESCFFFINLNMHEIFASRWLATNNPSGNNPSGLSFSCEFHSSHRDKFCSVIKLNILETINICLPYFLRFVAVRFQCRHLLVVVYGVPVVLSLANWSILVEYSLDGATVQHYSQDVPWKYKHPLWRNFWRSRSL